MKKERMVMKISFIIIILLSTLLLVFNNNLVFAETPTPSVYPTATLEIKSSTDQILSLTTELDYMKEFNNDFTAKTTG